jgi:bacterioferritin-associated ferredoxin
MGSLKRKYARKEAKRAKKEMKQQLTMFDKIGTECAACQEPFDRKSKEHAMTWNVVVREKEEIVRLYCPECWAKANKIIEEFNNDFRVQEERNSDPAIES